MIDLPTGDIYESTGSFSEVLNVPQVKPVLDKDSVESLRAMCMALDSITRAHSMNALHSGVEYAEKIATAITTMCTFVVVVESPNE